MKMLGSTDASLIGLGTQMLSEVAAGVLLGLGADYLLETHNRWVVVGSIMGVVVAMWTVIRMTIRLGKRDAAERARRAAERGNAASDDRKGGAA
jgi:F0F1-type ATP synthase assembly protein I